MARHRRKNTKHRVPGVTAEDIFETVTGLRQRPRFVTAGLELIPGLPLLIFQSICKKKKEEIHIVKFKL